MRSRRGWRISSDYFQINIVIGKSLQNAQKRTPGIVQKVEHGDFPNFSVDNREFPVLSCNCDREIPIDQNTKNNRRKTQ